MTNQPKEMGPKQLAWLEQHNPGFKHTRETCGLVIETARQAVIEALEKAAVRKEAA